ncbi:response regulator transcription factor [Clostridium chauvoei]|uniref:Stage 0 sporulation protein A homolog n=2 Tax=Clostridium chauvoei TaxID=46867 RepID=A0A1U6JN42_9CLOT|nr:response regulator transcription factor [Clostridium chauvoei]ATD55807.1 DNA-binding response regulator [Clostridium chauvoei]ATD56519.1 DNA-binding response regulator [Clostridium chauvoei]MBX7280165.1 response regulator transcription factor [Clostridium chauvoei]MBX7282725.1 response regulator transcription factor [Clostridium chauvoei]MBX7285056.1 response regulator transcription factor [Clostridium chauvoei]
MSRERILIVDDEKEIRDLVEIYLKGEGYDTVKAENGEEALEMLKFNNIDLIILDIMMPKLNGIEACLKIREEREMPIIMLSAKSEDLDKILGLNTGADDYLTKPFNPLELVARVKSQLRRYKRFNKVTVVEENIIEQQSNILEIDEISINLDTHEVFRDGVEIKLTPTEFDILVLLGTNRGKVFSIENIYNSVWKQEFMKSDNTVMVHIRKVREKIEEDPRKPRYIKTVWGVGYKIDR